jgi:hypothetical protein
VIRREYHIETFVGMVRLGCKQILFRYLSNQFKWVFHIWHNCAYCLFETSIPTPGDLHPKEIQQTTRPSKRSQGVASVCDVLLERDAGARIH